MTRVQVWQRLRCRWIRHRLQRYLDHDPAAPLSRREARRVREHLARCENCDGMCRQYRELTSRLATQGRWAEPATDQVMRVGEAARAGIKGGERG